MARAECSGKVLGRGFCEGMIAAFCGSFGRKSLRSGGDIVDIRLSVLRNEQCPGVGRPESEFKV